MQSLSQKQINNFLGKIDKEKSNIFYNGSRCWEWKAWRDKDGYGRWNPILGIKFYSHRLMYEITYGSIPGGLLVCHHCDNPPCCNPDHLFLGTNQDNLADRDEKGRQVSMRGEAWAT
jgi:hypothetical protein